MKLPIFSIAVLAVVLFFSSCKDKSTGNPSSAITALTCSSATFSSLVTINTSYSGTGTVPYTGGNAVAYAAGSSIASTEVTGLTAVLAAGTLANGAGSLTYAITGTPTTSGTAAFAISFGGQSCTLALAVNAASSTLSPYNKIYGATSITTDGTYIIIKSSDLPDHKSVYYATTNALYEAFSGTTYGGNTFSKNPNTISSQTLTFKIPANPAVAANHASTPLGPIGISLNGVPFYNQYAAGGSALTNEVAGFDQWWGHPQNSGQYHYHVEPKYLTTTIATKSSLLGFLLDGFPVYGPEENGATLTSADLDVYHGHTKSTAEYPNGIYHYHITADAPYINGSGFYGTAGTVSQ